MKKTKVIIITGIILGSLPLLFSPPVMPENFQVQEIFDLVVNSDVVIIFNSGGWGNTSPEKAEDFFPIINGIQETLKELNYDSIVIPYRRTKDSFLGRITGIKDFFSSFGFSSEILADEIEVLAEGLPNKKIIMAGLSNGGDLVIKTYEKISEKTKGSVFGITLGTPFWTENFHSENILRLDSQ